MLALPAGSTTIRSVLVQPIVAAAGAQIAVVVTGTTELEALRKSTVQPAVPLGYESPTMVCPSSKLETCPPPPITNVPAGQVAVDGPTTPEGALLLTVTYVSFEIDAEPALGTVPSLPRLICVPVSEWLWRRFPDSEPFLIRLLPLTSLLAAIADPDAARTSAMIEITSGADGVRLNILLMRCPLF
jgi:hypothetical protein